MPAPSHGQPLIARQGCPRWKPALLEVGPATARGSQQSRRVELPTEDLRDATGLALRGLHRLQSEQRPVGVRPLTPVEGRVGVEDLQSAHHEDEETEGGQPVAEPRGQRMAIDAALREDHDVLIRYTMQAARCAEIDSPSIRPTPCPHAGSGHGSARGDRGGRLWRAPCRAGPGLPGSSWLRWWRRR